VIIFGLVWFQDLKKKLEPNQSGFYITYVCNSHKWLEGITKREDYKLEIQNMKTHFNFGPETCFKIGVRNL